MPERVIRAADFARFVTEQLAEDTGIVRKAALDTTLWGEAKAVTLTNKAGSVDQGLFKNAWNHGEIAGGAELRNDAPYAGIIERGRRPGRPGPPLAPIYAWVQRKLRGQIRGNYRFAKRLALGLAGAKATAGARSRARKEVRAAFSTEERGVMAGALHAAFNIRESIHIRGTKPRWILRDTHRLMVPKFKAEALRRLRSKYR